jgi:hypothetical protein
LMRTAIFALGLVMRAIAFSAPENQAVKSRAFFARQ